MVQWGSARESTEDRQRPRRLPTVRQEAVSTTGGGGIGGGTGDWSWTDKGRWVSEPNNWRALPKSSATVQEGPAQMRRRPLHLSSLWLPKAPPALEEVLVFHGVSQITVGSEQLWFHDVARRKTKHSAFSAGEPQCPQLTEGRTQTTCTWYMHKHGVCVMRSLRFPGRFTLFHWFACLENSPAHSLPSSEVIEPELNLFFPKSWWRQIFSEISEPLFKFVF